MKNSTQAVLTWLVIGASGLGLAFWGSVTQAGTATSVFNFTATFVGGSCEISAPASIQFNAGNTLLSADIEQGIAGTSQQFDLTLSQCSGWGLTPAIKVSGQNTSDFGEAALFRDVMGPTDANGYGVLLTTIGNSSFSRNPNLAANGKIMALDWSTDAQLSSISTTLPIVATLTCGDCNYSGRQGGEFKATVTFDFVYE